MLWDGTFVIAPLFVVADFASDRNLDCLVNGKRCNIANDLIASVL